MVAYQNKIVEGDTACHAKIKKAPCLALRREGTIYGTGR
jgi:hypothetical protein